MKGFLHFKVQLNFVRLLKLINALNILITKLEGKRKLKTKLHGPSPRANYTDRATAACRQSDCLPTLRIEGATWSA
jgi:hypothetical protein